tara:strand:- start:417 stop:641 length:225 start_codon:yes stop_codon:yes gene_type:complete
MAYTRRTAHSGISVTVKQGSDGKWDFILKEHFNGATVDSKTGDQSGLLEIAKNNGIADWDTAAAEIKTALTALG